MTSVPDLHHQAQLGAKELLLLMLAIDGNGISKSGVGGITRLQKLLFLLWKEEHIEQVNAGFRFRPYKAGPYSRKLYDELELLENLGFITSEVQGRATEAEAVELEELSFEQLMGDADVPFADVETRSVASTADTFEERRYRLTDKGVGLVKELLADSSTQPFADGIRRIKSKFGSVSLQDLLYHVYKTYESDGWTSASEIRDRVLRKGPLR